MRIYRSSYHVWQMAERVKVILKLMLDIKNLNNDHRFTKGKKMINTKALFGSAFSLKSIFDFS